MAVEPRDVPWWWQALALIALATAGATVLRESAVHQRPGTAAANSGVRVDVNFASVEDLDSLPGIGPALARAIVAARPFSRPEDIERVRGISPAMAAQLLPLIQAAHGRRTADQR
jgi:competence protein ComEA